ncbi:hypothetical protein [Puniceibacterium confluentis]|uniref:hypothetical protein n=1 Tax=Puniceibacterium confluentis TaxID=1958944 RepID=UPI0011B595EF|nr:hypothetical protein [Puniceibacterium confluentis]
MPRWTWWLPVALIVALSALFGWRHGWVAANVTETQVIDAYATRYLQDRARDGSGAGARRSDCRARPSARAWLVVICGPEPQNKALSYTYYVARDGRLRMVVGPDDAAEGA